jgi:uncharacterized protein with NRDE domain
VAAGRRDRLGGAAQLSMCILLALRIGQGGEELWVAANRDERLDRSWIPPRLLTADPPVFGGQDLLAGGTWLAVNLGAHFVVGVSNARLGARPGERSRGTLVLDLAGQRSLPDAVALLGELDLSRYGAFNLLLADPASLWLASNSPGPSVERVDGIVAAIGNHPLSAGDLRVAATLDRGRELAAEANADLAARLQTLLADHDGEDPLCRHGRGYGTVCATVVRVRTGGVGPYTFAAGPPCTAPFRSIELPPAQRARGGE